MKFLDFLSLDGYDKEAVLIPAILSLILIIVASWGMIDYRVILSKYDSFSSACITSALLLVALFTLTVVWYQIVRITGKFIIEPLMFGRNLCNLPTTRYLLINDNFGDKLLASKTREKLEKDFGITMKNKAQEKKNPEEAKSIVESAVRLIRKQVQKENGDMYLRKNIRYGFFRNAVGGCIISLLVEIVFALFSIFGNHPFTVGWIVLAGTSILIVIFYLSGKNAAQEYAHELFESYITIE